mmetsp:Transcript_81402/g.218885  ORF Transcript_81402/g.218885 Transcript_81402/m.218885 type:complete len:338 (-) Transcript_81402:44-1057(-)
MHQRRFQDSVPGRRPLPPQAAFPHRRGRRHHGAHHLCDRYARRAVGRGRRRHPRPNVPRLRALHAALWHPAVQGHHLRGRRGQQLPQRPAPPPQGQQAAHRLQDGDAHGARAAAREHPRGVLQLHLALVAHHHPHRRHPHVHGLHHHPQGHRDLPEGDQAGGDGGGEGRPHQGEAGPQRPRPDRRPRAARDRRGGVQDRRPRASGHLLRLARRLRLLRPQGRGGRVQPGGVREPHLLVPRPPPGPHHRRHRLLHGQRGARRARGQGGKGLRLRRRRLDVDRRQRARVPPLQHHRGLLRRGAGDRGRHHPGPRAAAAGHAAPGRHRHLGVHGGRENVV